MGSIVPGGVKFFVKVRKGLTDIFGYFIPYQWHQFLILGPGVAQPFRCDHEWQRCAGNSCHLHPDSREGLKNGLVINLQRLCDLRGRPNGVD